MQTLQQRIDEELLRISAEREKRERSGKFGASSFGKCFRAQVFNRENIPPSEPLELKTLHMFEAGKIVHDYIQMYFNSKDTEVRIEDENYIGFADLVVENTAWDIKSVNPAYFFFGWKDKKKVEYTVQEIDALIPVKKLNNVLQVTQYAIELKKENIGLVFFSRDLSYGIRAHEWKDKTANWVDKVKAEKDKLDFHWDKLKRGGGYPLKEPRLYDGKECNYCQWKTFCAGM